MLKPTDPVKVIYKDGIELPPVSVAEANELIKRGHAEQIHGMVIQLFMTEQDRQALKQFVLWRDKGKCYFCGKKEATEVIRLIPRSEGGSDWSDNLRAACNECYKISPDPEDDKIQDTYQIIGKLPPNDKVYCKRLKKNWQVSRDVIKFYRQFYVKKSPYDKVQQKISNLLNNNANLVYMDEDNEYYNIGDFILIAKDIKVIGALTHEDFNNFF